jgi:hypothetical protein
MEREKDKMQSTRKNGKHLRVFLSDVFFQSVYYNLLLPNLGSYYIVAKSAIFAR